MNHFTLSNWFIKKPKAVSNYFIFVKMLTHDLIFHQYEHKKYLKPSRMCTKIQGKFLQNGVSNTPKRPIASFSVNT